MRVFSRGGFVKADLTCRFVFPEYRIVEVANAYGSRRFEVECRVGEGFAWESPRNGLPVRFDSLGAARRWRRDAERRDGERVVVGRRVVE